MRTVEWHGPALAMPTDSESRKATPITTGVLDYFPAALAEVAKVSKAGNDKHNPGEPLHHSRGKSTDHADSIGRHLIDRGGIDPDTGMLHSAELAWRALALLQQELEDRGDAPLARGASYDDEPVYDDTQRARAMRPHDQVPDIDKVRVAREQYEDPSTVADQVARGNFNNGVMAAAAWLEQRGWEGLAEEIEAVRVG